MNIDPIQLREEAISEFAMDYVRLAHRHTEGRAALIIGGFPRQEVIDNLKTILLFSEVRWLEDNDQRNSRIYEGPIDRADLVLLLTGWLSHKTDTTVTAYCKRVDKPFVRLGRSYSSVRIAMTIAEHWSNRDPIPSKEKQEMPIPKGYKFSEEKRANYRRAAQERERKRREEAEAQAACLKAAQVPEAEYPAVSVEAQTQIQTEPLAVTPEFLAAADIESGEVPAKEEATKQLIMPSDILAPEGFRVSETLNPIGERTETELLSPATTSLIRLHRQISAQLDAVRQGIGEKEAERNHQIAIIRSEMEAQIAKVIAFYAQETASAQALKDRLTEKKFSIDLLFEAFGIENEGGEKETTDADPTP